ncbi:sigma 54-interacting transcriptional regulator [bacterium]|nr:sigma 54-interacting transcriptional regulator [bacterium]
MGRPPSVSFRFEKNRLLQRSKNIELWDGWLDGQSHLIKRFLEPRSAHWNEYTFVSRLKHSILPKPSSAGYAKDGSFCYAMPVDFIPARNEELQSLPVFSALLLSLIHGLESRKIGIQWSPNHLVCDNKTGRIYLAGIHPLKEKPLHSNSLKHISLLSAFVSKHFPIHHELMKILRKWTRRKEDQLTGCLQDLLSAFTPQLNETILVQDWPCTRELELVAGLYRLAEQRKGRCLVFQAEAGEGKTTLLRQLYCDLLYREANTIYFSAHKEERAFHSIKKFLRLFQQNFGTLQQIPKDLTEESITRYFLNALEDSNSVTGFFIDNFQDCDASSKRCFLRLFQQCVSARAVFLVSSDAPVEEAADFVVTLPLMKATLKELEESITLPFWQEKQRRNYIHQIYERTSGNPLFFHEYLSEAIHNRQPEIRWSDGEWSFIQPGIPDFPDGLLDFYWNGAPELNPQEMSFLEVASVKGDLFNAGQRERKVVDSLVKKNVLMESEGRYRFRKPLFSQAIKKRLPPDRLKKIHRTLAEQLSPQTDPDSMMLLAEHYLKAGELSAALHWTCRSIREIGHSIEPLALSVLNELELLERSLSDSEKVILFREQGDLYNKRGKFPYAAASFRKAIEFAGDDVLRFHLGLLLVECRILQEDILSAQQDLIPLTPLLPLIKEESILFRYFIARGVCAHYRGPRSAEDFQKAFAFAESLGEDGLLAHGYRRYAHLLLKEGQLQEASKLTRKALRYAKLSGDTEEMGHCYKIFASIAWRKSRHEHAEKMMKKSIHAFQKTKNEFGCAGVWNLLGNVYLERYRFNEAVRSFEKAVALFGRLDHSREVSLAQFNMGLVYLEQGRLKDAEKIFLRCRAIDKASGNKWFYAYDLRALAVYCILQGYPRKATRLLKRTIQICEELKADGDILQTKMILLFHELDQGNYRDAHSRVSSLEQRLPELSEPLTEAEIHHLLAYYYGFLNETTKAKTHLKKSLSIGRKIQHYKLIGKNLILSLIFRNAAPRQDDPDLRKAISHFKKSKNHLEFADYLLKFYQAYPVLLKEKFHLKKLHWMESLYRKLHIRPRLSAVRNLHHFLSSRDSSEPVYDWWRTVLALLERPGELQSKLMAVLKELGNELHSSYNQVQYLTDSGTFDRILYTDAPITNTVEELPAKIFDRLLRRHQTLCVDVRSEPELSANPWVILNEVRSILAIPFSRKDQFLGLWYFERRRDAPVFSSRDLQKAAFFSMVCSPLLEKAIDQEVSRQIPGSAHGFEDWIGVSKGTLDLARLVEKVAPLDVSVLILGESGTGKELVARNIHRNSKRAVGPFVALNCSAIPETLIESELFGHSRGAFTGAVAAKAGSVERAHGGTLFLDEIGDLSAAAQAKLLRVVQEREVQRLGETSVRKVNVRFLFATHKNLERLVRDGAYREDLFYRINGYTLTVPPLRERREDIPLLVRYFAEKYSQAFGKQDIRFSNSAMKALCDYRWPGNVREMENLIQTVLVNSDSGSVVEAELLPRSLKTLNVTEKIRGLSLEEGREEFDREFVLQALNKNNWNKSRTAKELRVTRQGLINMIQRLCYFAFVYNKGCLRQLSVIVVLVVFSFFACGNRSEEKPSSINISVPYELDVLDPHAKTRVSNYAISSNFYEPLVGTDETNKILPRLAKSWENPDAYTWVFHLQPNVRFHDGKIMDAGDVLYTFERLATDNNLEVGSYLNDVQQVEALSSTTIQVRTKTPLAIFLNKLNNVLIVSRGSSPLVNTTVNGTGPYRLTKWTPGKIIRMVRNNDYWGNKPSIQDVTYFLNRTPQLAVSDLVAGRSQFVQYDSKKLEPVIRSLGKYQVMRQDNYFLKYLSYDVSRSVTPYSDSKSNPFKNPLVRKAIHRGINREHLIGKLPTFAVPAFQPVPPFVFGHNPDIRAPSHDIDEAKKLLVQAGYANGFGVTLFVRQILEETGTLIQEQLANIGIQARTKVFPDTEFFKMLDNQDFSFFLSRVGATVGDASDILEPQLHSRSSHPGYGVRNYIGYSNEKVDKAIDESAQILKLEDRRKALEGIMQTLMEDLPWIPLYIDQDVYALHRSYHWKPRHDSLVFAFEISVHQN